MKKKRPKPLRKTGLPPGSLVHVGEIKTARPSITLIEYDAAGLDERSFASVEESRGYTPTRQKLWLNVYGLQDPEILGEIGRRFGLHPLVLEDILNTHQRSKFEEYDDYLYCVVRLFDVDPATQTVRSDQLSLVLGKNFVLSFQERPRGVFEPIRERLRGPRSPIREHGVDYLAYALLDAVIDRYFVVVDYLGEAAEDLEDQAMGPANLRLLQAIKLVKHDTLQVRRAVWPLREVLANLLRGESPFFARDTRLYLRDIYDHTIHVVETLDTVRDLLGDLVDIYMSGISNRLNLEVRILAVLSMLFMPATLIAGIFGMNFHSMPLLEKPDGFWVALGMMAAMAATMGLIFWRRKLLRG
jgi:magnesium transporter